MYKVIGISIFILFLSTSSLFSQLIVVSTGKKKYESTVSSNLNFHTLKVKVEAPMDKFQLTGGGTLEIKDISYLFEIQVLNAKFRNIRYTMGFDIMNNKLQTQFNGFHGGVGYNILNKEILELHVLYTIHLSMSESKRFNDPNVANTFYFSNPSISEFSINMEYSLGPKKIAYLLLSSGINIPGKTTWVKYISTYPYYYQGGGGDKIIVHSIDGYRVDFMKSFFVGIGLGINLASED